jgi:peptidoglycan/xylan/chitin deacetylase (PgdA/CDA1 family)
MNFYPTKFPFFFRRLFTSLHYDLPNNNRKIYLTFDDGPTPEITQWVMNELDKVQAKATFFCIGNNVVKYPEIVTKLLQKGHQIANHSYNHAKGWNTTVADYIAEISKTEKLLQEFTKTKKLFRPPYGRITRKQINEMQALDYHIIMWTIVVGDFSQGLNPKKAIDYLSQKTQAGSILVFHDSVKAFPKLKQILPEVLQNLKNAGFVFDTL